MKKLFAILALGVALMGLGGTVHAQDAASAAAASAPAAAAADAASAPMAAASSASAPAAAASGPVETVNKGDVSWMLVSTALVIMMSIPGLALFYGGLVRSKNMLSVLMQVFVTFSMITVLWVIYGYSLAFTEGNE
ncbi:MAG: ammonia channel protein, partial [Burkholderiales bacterium]|nr:ammonia channel protein [Burkholderiales bacterium]